MSPPLRFALPLALMLVLPAALLAQSGAAQDARFRVTASVWTDGVLRGEPEMVLVPGEPGEFRIDGPESAWRIRVEIEPPSMAENAGADSLWFQVGIEQRVDGEWTFLTDTMLGTPLGEPARISVVADEESGRPAGRDESLLFIELMAARAPTD